MAIIRLDCNLNGGDSVTPNNELFYRIYGDVDNYAAPIHTTGTALTDANVTVDGDNVIITGVNGTTNVEFKISAIDLAGNESILSDAVGSIDYKVTFQEINTEWGAFSSTYLFTDSDWYIEFVCDTVADVLNEVISGFAAKINIATVGRFQVYSNTSQGGQSDSDTMSRQPYTAVKIKVQRVGSEVSVYEDDVLAFTWTGITSEYSFASIAKFSAGYAENISFHWIDMNGEMFNLNEGSGSIATGSLGKTITLNSTASVDAMWSEIT